MYLLETGKRTIELEWTTFAMKRYCDIKGVTLDKFTEAINSNDPYNVVYIVMAAMDYVRFKNGDIATTKEIEACDIVDECGGLFSMNKSLYDFFPYIVSKMVSPDLNVDGKKKAVKVKGQNQVG